ncbi:hypothetical protein BS50DRAFT_252163 [Corynespora cassiicola Philippines]|uniref:Uncharacterized protein n=1 Tax=Corynespora cassiicola Philippines TaxID=1448308 RepID=A0A2T2P461_CORCC|nr:hypothetical protein BS50DRAFT_252163 [Corynespora cassiicola Philippines]
MGWAESAKVALDARSGIAFLALSLFLVQTGPPSQRRGCHEEACFARPSPRCSSPLRMHRLLHFPRLGWGLGNNRHLAAYVRSFMSHQGWLDASADTPAFSNLCVFPRPCTRHRPNVLWTRLLQLHGPNSRIHNLFAKHGGGLAEILARWGPKHHIRLSLGAPLYTIVAGGFIRAVCEAPLAPCPRPSWKRNEQVFCLQLRQARCTTLPYCAA